LEGETAFRYWSSRKLAMAVVLALPSPIETTSRNCFDASK
jgi:hypothetical protein